MVHNTIDVTVKCMPSSACDINMTNLRQACSILNIIVRHLHDFLNLLIYRQGNHYNYYIKQV